MISDGIDNPNLHLDYYELCKALASAIHKVPSLTDVPVYAERQSAIPKLPAVFIDLVDASEEYHTSGRRVMEQRVQLMLSVDPDMHRMHEWMCRIAVALMAALEYIPWNGLVFHTWDRSWTISGSDLVVSLSVRHHHLIEKE